MIKNNKWIRYARRTCRTLGRVAFFPVAHDEEFLDRKSRSSSRRVRSTPTRWKRAGRLPTAITCTATSSSSKPPVPRWARAAAAGKVKDDEFFGKVENLIAKTCASRCRSSASRATDSVTLKAVSQGCADAGCVHPANESNDDQAAHAGGRRSRQRQPPPPHPVPRWMALRSLLGDGGMPMLRRRKRPSGCRGDADAQTARLDYSLTAEPICIATSSPMSSSRPPT